MTTRLYSQLTWICNPLDAPCSTQRTRRIVRYKETLWKKASLLTKRTRPLLIIAINRTSTNPWVTSQARAGSCRTFPPSTDKPSYRPCKWRIRLQQAPRLWTWASSHRINTIRLQVSLPSTTRGLKSCTHRSPQTPLRSRPWSRASTKRGSRWRVSLWSQSCLVWEARSMSWNRNLERIPVS